MRRMIAMAAVAALVGAATLAPTPVPAAEATKAPIAAPQFLHQVQFYGGAPYQGDHGWERRRHRREWRQERDEARIAEAARREAYRIEAEREQRRAWRRAQHGHGYGPAYGLGQHRSW